MSWLETGLAGPPREHLAAFGLKMSDLLGTWVDNDRDVNYCFPTDGGGVIAWYYNRDVDAWSSWSPGIADFEAHARLGGDDIPPGIRDYLDHWEGI